MTSKKIKKRLNKFLLLSFLGLFIINFSIVTAYIIYTKFGTITLAPGEKYTLNIPFAGPTNFPTICGKAIKTNGELVNNVTVFVSYKEDSKIIMRNTTNEKGEFCLTLPAINKSTAYDIYIEYNNSTLTLASNDYEFNWENHKVYRKSEDRYVFLRGNITNRDAPVEDGRFEIKMGRKVNGTWKYIFGDYRKYYVNIEPGEIYEVPSSELNFSWDISELEEGEYKFLLKSSFNGKEYASSCSKCSVFFNVTS